MTRQSRDQRGVALAMLLWFIAAMLLLLAGIVALARVDVRMTQWQQQAAEAAALGDGAARLLLRDLIYARSHGEYLGRGIFAGHYELGGQAISVRAVPVAGLIDLNSADEILLTELFVRMAGVEPLYAETLAQRVIVWRTPGVEGLEETDEYLAAGLPYGPRFDRLRVREDLMQVLGVTRDIYNRVEALVHTRAPTGSRVDLLSAPYEVMLFLTNGDVEQSMLFVQERALEPYLDLPLPPAVDERFVTANSELNSVRIDARVAMADGKILQRRIWVSARGMGGDQLPWHFVRVEPVRQVESLEFVAHEGEYGY